MEIRFDRDLRHNYMVLCGLRVTGDYRLRMLSENTPAGLLRCSMRSINGDGYLYYEIDSRQPLKNRYADGNFGSEDLQRLLAGIRQLGDTLEEYLLDMEHVLFSTDHIYVDIRTGEFLFAYCPFSEGEEDTDRKQAYGFASFAEELLELLDPDDARAAQTAYLICELAGRGDMLLRDILQAAREDLEEADDVPAPGETGGSDARGIVPEDAGENGCRGREDGCVRDPGGYPGADPFPERLSGNRPGSQGADMLRTGASFYDLPDDDDDPEEDDPATKGGPGGILLAVLFAVVFAVNLYIRKAYVLNAQENILSLAVAGVSLFLAVLSLLLMFSGKKGDQETGSRREREEDDAGSRGYEGRTGSAGRRSRRGTGAAEEETGAWLCGETEEAGLVGAFPAGAPDGRSTPVARRTAADPTAAAFDEETTILDAASMPFGRKLYGRNPGVSVNIPLDKLPLTVGKLRGCAEFVIDNPSISRLHARFFSDTSGMTTLMKDLNSTNGTYLNGRRLNPNETVSIREGDEIGLGQLVFEMY